MRTHAIRLIILTILYTLAYAALTSKPALSCGGYEQPVSKEVEYVVTKKYWF